MMTLSSPLRSLLLMVPLLVACGGAAPAPANDPGDAVGRTERPDASPTTAALAGPPAVPSTIIAELHRDDIDWAFARHGESAMLLVRKDGRFLTGPVRLVGSDRALPDLSAGLRDVGPAPRAQGTPTVLRGVDDGFLLMWTEPSGNGSKVRLRRLDDRGATRGDPTVVTTTDAPVIWVDVLYDPKGGTWLLWETETSRGATVKLKAHPAGETVVGATDVRGWHAVAGPRGAVLAFVQGDAGRAVSLTDDGLSPVVELGSVGAKGDVLAAALTDRYVVGWTAVDGDDRHIAAAVMGYDGTILRPAQPAVPPVAPTRLQALVPASDASSVLFSYERDEGRAPRTFVLKTMSPDLDPVVETTLAYHGRDGGGPHVVADGTGFTAVTLVPPKMRQGASASSSPAPSPAVAAVPTFVRLDATLAPRAAEPVRLEPLAEEDPGDGVPAAVRGLMCARDRCTVLAEGTAREPTLVVLADLPVRKSPWAAPLLPAAPRGGPTLSSLTKTATASRRVAALSAAPLSDGRTLVAWVTEGADGGTTPTSRVAAQVVAADGTPGPVHTISERGVAVGGVRVVASPGGANGRGGGLGHVVWAGPSQGVSQVYITALDAQGRKGRQKTLTRLRRSKAKNPLVLDVDAIADGTGLIVTWSDTRHGNQEVHLARVDRQLTRRGKAVRVTTTPGVSGEPRLHRAGDDDVWLAWTDTGAGERPGVMMQRWRREKAGLRPAGDRIRVDEGGASNARYARSPRFSEGAPGATVLSWIDDGGIDGASVARWLPLEAAATAAPSRTLTVDGAQLSSLVMRCPSADRCQGLAMGKDGDTLALAPFVLPRAGRGADVVTPRARLPRGSTQDLGPVAPDDDHVYFVRDQAGGGRGVIRRLRVAW
ncbi:MAG: hypothetical protein AAF715_18205 [Myxococcota bacterium]